MANALAIEIGGVDVTNFVAFETLQMQLAGSQETASCTFDVENDPSLSLSIIAEMLVTVTDVGSSDVLFGGFIRSNKPDVNAVGRTVHVAAYDYNNLLDRQLVISDARAAGESDNDRLVYLMTTYGDQFSADYSQIATLNGAMPKQGFVAISLRQAIERVLGQASTLSAYNIDPTGRLVTYDRSSTAAAPFDVVVDTPGVGEISVDDFTFDFDSSNLANAIYVVGSTAAGSGWFTDPTSIATYGRRERFFNAPDSDTSAKAAQVGAAALEDQKDPVPRGQFTTQSPNDGWRIGQHVVITSPPHGLVAATLRIARVTARYLNGVGDRNYTIEVGAPLPTLSALLAKSHGAGGGGAGWSTPGSSGWWRGFTIDDLGNLFGTGDGCTCNPCCPPWDGIGTPDSGVDVVNEFGFSGDGFTTAGTTAHPYVPGSLAVWVAGLNATSHKSEDDPSTGAYSLDFAPTAGQTVRLNYTTA